MNITESNQVSLLLRALHGDELDPDTVLDAAIALDERINSALQSSPGVDHGVLLANVVSLQVMTAVVHDETALDEDPAGEVLDALEDSGLLPGAKDLKLTGART